MGYNFSYIRLNNWLKYLRIIKVKGLKLQFEK